MSLLIFLYISFMIPFAITLCLRLFGVAPEDMEAVETDADPSGFRISQKMVMSFLFGAGIGGLCTIKYGLASLFAAAFCGCVFVAVTGSLLKGARDFCRENETLVPEVGPGMTAYTVHAVRRGMKGLCRVFVNGRPYEYFAVSDAEIPEGAACTVVSVDGDTVTLEPIREE